MKTIEKNIYKTLTAVALVNNIQYESRFYVFFISWTTSTVETSGERVSQIPH